eukprot:355550-Chlamydomonas_euryale.AAC.4
MSPASRGPCGCAVLLRSRPCAGAVAPPRRGSTRSGLAETTCHSPRPTSLLSWPGPQPDTPSIMWKSLGRARPAWTSVTADGRPPVNSRSLISLAPARPCCGCGCVVWGWGWYAQRKCPLCFSKREGCTHRARTERGCWLNERQAVDLVRSPHALCGRWKKSAVGTKNGPVRRMVQHVNTLEQQDWSSNPGETFFCL